MQTINERKNERTNEPTDQLTDQQTSRSTGQPANRPTGQPANRPTGHPAIRPNDQPTKQRTVRRTKERRNERKNKQMKQTTNQLPNQPTNLPNNQPTNERTNEPSSEWMNEWINHWINESISLSEYYVIYSLIYVPFNTSTKSSFIFKTPNLCLSLVPYVRIGKISLDGVNRKVTQVSSARLPWRLIILRRRLLLTSFQYGTCFMTPVRRIEFWGGFQIFGKLSHPSWIAQYLAEPRNWARVFKICFRSLFVISGRLAHGVILRLCTSL